MTFQTEKNQLINTLKEEGITDQKVLKAIQKVPRHEFVPQEYQKEAYANYALPIAQGQTISQPFTVAFMLQALELKPGQKVLEIGTGSGYNAALIAELIKPQGQLYTTEIYESLIKKSKKILQKYKNTKKFSKKISGVPENQRFSTHIHLIKTDGSQGYKKAAPYDRIIATAAAPDIPKPWLEQLKEKGIIVAPIGHHTQIMVKITKIKNQIQKQELGYFQFVPLKGEYGY